MPKIDVRRFATRAELDAALADRLEEAIRATAKQSRQRPRRHHALRRTHAASRHIAKSPSAARRTARD